VRLQPGQPIFVAVKLRLVGAGSVREILLKLRWLIVRFPQDLRSPMKTTAMQNHLLPAAVIFVAATLCHAEEGHFYFNADLGVATVSDVELRNVFNEKFTAEIDVGPRLSLSGGYEFCGWFAAGAELSIIQASGSSDYWQAPLIANFEFRLPNKSRFTPFIGGGPGVAYRNFSRSDVGQDIEGHLAEVSFVWQVNAGLRYALSDRCSIGIIYRYLDLNSTGENNFEWGSDQGISTQVEGTQTQSISVSFGLKF
jgi:hypothetical protein